MSDLIAALQIFLKYADLEYPTTCEHDTLYIVGIDPAGVSEEDKARLDELGFIPGDHGGFLSHRFGSA